MDAMFRTSNKYYRAYVNELEYVRNNIILKLFLPGLFKFLVNGKNIYYYLLFYTQIPWWNRYSKGTFIYYMLQLKHCHKVSEILSGVSGMHT